MKRWTENLKGLIALDYVTFINVPMVEYKHGPIIDLPPNFLETLAAKAIIKESIPLRGREVKFLRKTIGLSLEKFANQIGLTSGAIFRWEQAQDEHLSPINEIAVRTFIADKLNVEIPGKFSKLIGKVIFEIELQAS